MTSKPEPETLTEHENDPDWAPQIPSIWDVADDPEPDSWINPEASLDRDPFASPLPIPDRGLHWHRPEDWRMAEREVGRELLDAAVAIARLDERLVQMSAVRRAGLRERLALDQVSDVLWAEGARLRPEHLALADRDRIGRSLDEDQVIARARWAVRRMTSATALPVTPALVRAFLGLHESALRDTVDPDADPESFDDALWIGLDRTALGEWCAVLADLGDTHPLTRAAAGLNLWRGFALNPMDRLCEPLLLAARIGGAAGQGGLLAIPLDGSGAGSGGILRGGGEAAQRLSRWLQAVQAATLKAQRNLDDLDAWTARATAATVDLNGKSPAALIQLFEARPVASAKDCASVLGRTSAQVRQILRIFEDRGLITEITGQKRFRFWKARL